MMPKDPRRIMFTVPLQSRRFAPVGRFAEADAEGMQLRLAFGLDGDEFHQPDIGAAAPVSRSITCACAINFHGPNGQSDLWERPRFPGKRDRRYLLISSSCRSLFDADRLCGRACCA